MCCLLAVALTAIPHSLRRLAMSLQEPSAPDANASRPALVCVPASANQLSFFLSDQSLEEPPRAERYGTGKVRYIADDTDEASECDLTLLLNQPKAKPKLEGATSADGEPAAPVPVTLFADERCLEQRRCSDEQRSNPNEAGLVRKDADMLLYHTASDPDDAVTISLTPHFRTPFIGADELPAASARGYMFNLVVSQDTSVQRTRWHALATTWQEYQPSGFMHVTREWSDPARDPNLLFESNTTDPEAMLQYELESLPRDKWRAVLLNSSFTLSPAGHNIECFRLFEAAEAGSIPVVSRDEFDNDYGKCTEPLQLLIASGAPFLFVHSPTEARETMVRLTADPHRLDSRSQAVRAWYDRYMTALAQRVEGVFLGAASARRVGRRRTTRVG